MPRNDQKDVSNPALVDLLQRRAEIDELIKFERSSGTKRKALLGYCTRHGLTRADLRAVTNDLPLERISAKHRLATGEKQLQDRRTKRHPKFASVISKARLAKGLSPQQVADKVKVHIASVHGWERGVFFPNKPGIIPKLMELLDLPEAAFKRG